MVTHHQILLRTEVTLDWAESFPINHSASREIPGLLRTLKIDYCVNKITPLMPILSQHHNALSLLCVCKWICSASLYSHPRSRSMWCYTKHRKNKNHISSRNNIQRVASWYICLAALELSPTIICRCIHMARDNISIQPVCRSVVAMMRYVL
jgi:hypothetical protein